jgi:hypothetical protein
MSAILRPTRLKARSDCARRRAASLKGPSRDVARRRSAERQKSRSNRTRLDFSGIDAAQLSGVARRRAQSECCRSYQCVRFQRRRAAPRDVARSVSGALPIAIFSSDHPLFTSCYQFTDPGGSMDGLIDRAHPGNWTRALWLMVNESQRRAILPIRSRRQIIDRYGPVWPVVAMGRSLYKGVSVIAEDRGRPALS